MTLSMIALHERSFMHVLECLLFPESLDDFEACDPKDPRWRDEDERPHPDAASSGLRSPERGKVPTLHGQRGSASEASCHTEAGTS
jgi:hypothetical protein